MKENIFAIILAIMLFINMLVLSYVEERGGGKEIIANACKTVCRTMEVSMISHKTLCRCEQESKN